MKGYEATKKIQKQTNGRRKKAAPPPPENGQFPWLVHDRSIKYPNQTFFSPRPVAPPIDIYRQRIPALKQKKVFSCSFGYLVLYDYKHRLLSLFNCTTFDTTPLPKLNPANTINSCVLSSSPKSPNCKVLVFLENCQFIMCCRIRSNGWTEIRYENQFYGWTDRMRVLGGFNGKSVPYLCFYDPVICRGKIFAFFRVCRNMNPELWSIEIVDKEDEEVELMLSRLNPCRLKDEFVVESDGELYRFSVNLKTTGYLLEVEMRKLNRDGMVWERVDSLKNRSFFICKDYCVSCPTPGLDCVFITMAKDPSLYTYNLEEDSLSVSLPFGTSSGPIQNHPFWMVPEVLTRQEEDHFNQEETEVRLLDSEKEDDEEKTLLTDLPLDTLNEVAKLLTPHEYLNFRSLSRQCQLAAPLVNWRNRTDHSSFPLLMFAVKCRSLYRFVHPLQNRAQSYLMTVPDRLKDARIHYSNHGWLLMAATRRGVVHVYMYNLFTKDIRDYVSPWGIDQVLFFTSKPSSSTCFLIAITWNVAYVTTASTPYQWTRHELHHTMLTADNIPSPVLFRNAFYFLSKHGELARLYFEDDNISLQDLSRTCAPCRDCHQNFLVECGGHLLSVFVGQLGKWIRVYKLDESKLVWETATSLKGYALSYLWRLKLWSIEIVDKEEGGIVLSRLDASRFKDGNMVESDGEVYCVSVHLSSKNRDIKAVEMRKLSCDGRDWERVDTLKNRSFFTCQNYSVSCPTPGLDCVFFTMAEDLSLYTYNLGDDSLSATLPFGTLSRPIQSRPFWMMPEVLIRQEEDCCNQGQCEARLFDSVMEDDEEKTLLTDLPLDLLNDVAKLLNPHDCLSFRSLSRACRSAAPLSNWRKRTDHMSFPLHMFAVKCRGLYRFVHPLQNRAQSYLMTIPDCLKDAKVRYSNHGWLLMSAKRSGVVHFYLYNPFTKDIRSYVGRHHEPEILFFTSKPSSSTCFLVEISCNFAYTSNASTLHQWTSHVLDYRTFNAADNCPSPVLFQNFFYFLNKDGDIARFCFEENNVRFQDLMRPYTPFSACHQSFLVECGGDLLSIFVGHMGKWIRVYKLNLSNWSWNWGWNTVTSLKGYALYLSQASSFSEMASPGLDNRIYFPRFRDGGALYYALDRAEWKFVGSEETLRDFSGTELQLHSCWIKPSWS